MPTKRTLSSIAHDALLVLRDALHPWCVRRIGEWAKSDRWDQSLRAIGYPSDVTPEKLRDLSKLLKVILDTWRSLFEGHLDRTTCLVAKDLRNAVAHHEALTALRVDSDLARFIELCERLGDEQAAEGLRKLRAEVQGPQTAPAAMSAQINEGPQHAVAVLPSEERLSELFGQLVQLLEQGHPHVVTYGWLYRWAVGEEATGQGHYLQAQRWATSLDERRDASQIKNLCLDSFVVGARTEQPGKGHFAENRGYTKDEWKKAFNKRTVLHTAAHELPAQAPG
jgi:hypothetical protein